MRHNLLFLQVNNVVRLAYTPSALGICRNTVVSAGTYVRLSYLHGLPLKTMSSIAVTRSLRTLVNLLLSVEFSVPVKHLASIFCYSFKFKNIF